MSNSRNDEQQDVTAYPAMPAGAGESALQPGTTIHEFRILRLIGEGGFGIVYLAHDESLDRTVALKEYMPSQLAERTEGTASVQVRSERHAETFAAGMRSFINEARLLARFDHPSLLKVYRFFQENGTAYMAMPFLEGQTLKAVLRGLSGPPDERWLRRILYQVLDGLEVIHGYDCYHRDIAPDNILLQNDVPILLDFGAARRVIGDMTQNLTVILKPGYAPIEQYADDPGMKQGAWTDIYALAGVVHFALTRQAPPPAVGRAVSDQFVPLAQRMRGVYSDGFLKTIDAALSVRPQDRPQSIRELRAMLLASDEGAAAARAPSAPVLAVEPWTSRAEAATGGTQPPHGVTAPVVSATPEPAVAPVKSRPPVAPGGSPWRNTVAGLALAVAAAGAALWWVMSRTDEPPPTEAQAPAEPKLPDSTPASVSPARVEQAAPAAPPPPVALAVPVQPPPPPVAAAPKPPEPPPLRADTNKAKAPEPSKSAPVAIAKAPEPPKPAAVAPAKAPEPPKAPAVAAAKPEPVAPPARVEVRPAPQPAPRVEEPAEAPKPPPQQVARVEPKPEPPPPAKAETPKPPVEVARVEPPKAAAPAPQPLALLGRYTGRVMAQGTPVGVTLVIQSVQDGAASGTASLSTGPCQGEYRMTGTVREDAVRMRSTHAGGRYGDCSFGFRGAVQGTKLVGQTGNGTPLELSR